MMEAQAELEVSALCEDGPALPPEVLTALAGEGAVLYGLPAADYHRAEAMSNSGADKILRSPAHYRLMRTTPNEPTPQMQFGTCVHDGVLEPEAFDSRVCVAPSVDKRTNVGKATWADFCRDNAGKIWLSQDAFDRARRCIDAVHAHPAAVQLLTGGEREITLFWQDGEFKVPCKARIDIRNLGGLTDLKTSADASKDGFSKSIFNYGYHRQGAWYFSGCEHVFDATPEFFIFIVVESEPPHAVAVYELGRPSILAGMNQAREALRRYRDALAAGQWPGYAPTIETINAPRWALRDTYY